MSHKKPTSIPGIYLITNRVNGRIYVGQARNIGSRWSHHKHLLARGTHNNPFLQRAWNKLGPDAFLFTIAVDLSETPKEHLAAEKNRYEALVFTSCRRTYNLLHPGLNGPTPKQGTREKLSAAKKAMWDNLRADPAKIAEVVSRANAWRYTPEGRAMQSEWFTEKWQIPEFRAALSKRSAEKWDKPGYRENHTNNLKNAWSDPEKREQRIAGLKAAWADPKIRAARLEAIRVGRAKAMEDPNGKMRQRPKKRWAAADARAKQADKSRETWADPAIKAKRCAALKAAWVIRRARLAAA